MIPAGSRTAAAPDLLLRRDDPSRTHHLQVIEFLLGGDHYAIDLFDVREVVECTTITHLPASPPFVRGIIDLRGEITTIIDLKARLAIREQPGQPAGNSRIIVLDEKIARMRTGILVDEVLSVSLFERGDIDPASVPGTRDNTAVRGIIKKKIRDRDKERHDLIIWIDIRVLAGDDGKTTGAAESPLKKGG